MVGGAGPQALTAMASAPDFSLKGKLALITGSTQGLGLAIAGAYAASGAGVIVNGRRAHRVDTTVAGLRTRGHVAHPFVYDLGNVVGPEQAYQALCQQVGKHEIGGNNVGIRNRTSPAQAKT